MNPMRVRKCLEPDINRCKEDKDTTDSPTNDKGKLDSVGMKESQF